MSNQSVSEGIIGDLSEIGRDLLVMEICTIASDTITGRKMPWFPHAVIDVLAKYADWFSSVPKLKMRTILGLPRPITRDAFIELTLGEKADDDTPMTNGWRSIEQLRRTAKLIVDDDLMKEVNKTPLDHLERGIAIRIRRNCDQLKSIVMRFRTVEAWQPYFLTAKARKNIELAQIDTASDVNWTNFRDVDDGLTRAQISQSLETFNSIGAERAVLDSEAATRLRKIWELGTDQIIAQTIVQVDGDTLTRFQRGVDDDVRTYYLNIHNQGVHTAIRQWKVLFDAFSALIDGVADRIFGRTV